MTLQRPLDRNATLEEQGNNRIDEDYFQIVRNLGEQVFFPNSLVELAKKDLGAGFVPSGQYGGAVVSGTRQMLACSPGTTFSKTLVVRGSLLIKNGSFVCDGNNPAIVVEAGGRLLMSDCFISKEPGLQAAATDRYITIETGGYGSFNNCAFFGDQAAVGTIITNEDILNPQRAAVVGCINLTSIVAAGRYVNVGYVQDVVVA